MLLADRKMSHLVLTWQDLDVLTAINEALAPLADFTDVMSGENYVTGSAILPIMDLLYNSVLQEKEEDKPLTKELGCAIVTDLQFRNTSPEVEVCSYMDPRFKTKYIDDEMLESVKKTVYNDRVHVCRFCPTTLQSSSEAEPAGKRKRTLGSLFKAHQSDEETHSPCISPEQKVKSEVSKYIDEQRIDVEQDPLTWWRLRRELYPVLTYVCS